MKRSRSSDSVAGGELYGEMVGAACDGAMEDDEELFTGEVSMVGEKKRRLSLEQVRALEKNFEVENKLDPERKVRIAIDLGLQPRQVAVWFQNRRARWKTKQLERDYVALRNSYDTLAVDCDALRRDKKVLLDQIKELKLKLGVKEEDDSDSKEAASADRPTAVAETAPYKDGASDSDSSAAVFDENSPYRCGMPLPPDLHLLPDDAAEQQSMATGSAFDFHLSSEWRVQRSFFPKEERSFNAGEENSSDLFSCEQNPIFSWYCSDHWS